MSKPIIFISHQHEDQRCANILERIICDALLDAITVFNSSNRRSIIPGDPFRDYIISTLRDAKVVLVLASPESVKSPWVNFEAGGAWLANRRVVPCCIRGMEPSRLPSPLCDLQAIDIGTSLGIGALLTVLSEMAGLRFPEKFDTNAAANEVLVSWERDPSKDLPSNILFHHVVQLNGDELRFRIGYNGQGLLNDVGFNLCYVILEEFDDGGPARCWIDLTLERSFVPEVRTTFHIRHNLNRLELPSGAKDLSQLQQLPGSFLLTVKGTDSKGHQLRNRHPYDGNDIRKGRFSSLAGDAITKQWVLDSNKPPVEWQNFYKFDPDS